MIIEDNDDLHLEHFGVKGMRWGVINKDKPQGRDKAANLDKQARRDAKAEKYVQKANEAQKRLDLAKKGPDNISTAAEIDFYQKRKDRALVDAERKRQGKLSINQRRVVIGAAVVTALVAAKMTQNSLESGYAHALAEKGKAYIHHQNGLGWKSNQKLASKMSEDELLSEVVAHINPGYGKKYGTRMNCRRATFAYEMRRRGYDVRATRTGTARGQDPGGLFNATHPKVNNVPAGVTGVVTRIIGDHRRKAQGKPSPFLDEVVTPKKLFGKHTYKNNIFGKTQLFDDLKALPDGARGEMGLKWKVFGGHSIAWEKVGVKTVFFDCQSGKKYDENSIFELLNNASEMGITRLDDAPLDESFLKRWVINA